MVQNVSRRDLLKAGWGISLGLAGEQAEGKQQQNKAREFWEVLTSNNWGYKASGLQNYHQTTGHSGKDRHVLAICAGFTIAHPLFNPLYKNGENEFKPYYLNVQDWFKNGYPNVDDISPNGHGTGVLGILWQAAPNAYYHIAKADAEKESEILEALKYARRNKGQYDVVTISMGVLNIINQGEKIREVANEIPDNNTLFVAATGNDVAFPEPPSTASKAIAVASMTRDGELHRGGSPSFRRRGKPDLVAPGKGVLTVNSTDGWRGRPAAKSGSSFATPHVAGIALLLSKYSSAPEIRTALLETAEDIPQETIDGEGRVSMMTAYEWLEGSQSDTDEDTSDANKITARFEDNLDAPGTIENNENWAGDTYWLYTWEEALEDDSSDALPTDTGWGGPDDLTSEYYDRIGDNFLIQKGGHRESRSRFSFSDHANRYPDAPYKPTECTIRVGSNVFASIVEGGSEAHLKDSEGNSFFAVTFGASGGFEVDYTEIKTWDDDLKNNGLFEIRIQDIDWENGTYHIEVYEQTVTGYKDSPILSETDSIRSASNVDEVELFVGHDKFIYIDNLELTLPEGSQGSEKSESESGAIEFIDCTTVRITGDFQEVMVHWSAYTPGVVTNQDPVGPISGSETVSISDIDGAPAGIEDNAVIESVEAYKDSDAITSEPDLRKQNPNRDSCTQQAKSDDEDQDGDEEEMDDRTGFTLENVHLCKRLQRHENQHWECVTDHDQHVFGFTETSELKSLVNLSDVYSPLMIEWEWIAPDGSQPYDPIREEISEADLPGGWFSYYSYIEFPSLARRQFFGEWTVNITIQDQENGTEETRTQSFTYDGGKVTDRGYATLETNLCNQVNDNARCTAETSSFAPGETVYSTVYVDYLIDPLDITWTWYTPDGRQEGTYTESISQSDVPAEWYSYYSYFEFPSDLSSTYFGEWTVETTIENQTTGDREKRTQKFTIRSR